MERCKYLKRSSIINVKVYSNWEKIYQLRWRICGNSSELAGNAWKW